MNDEQKKTLQRALAIAAQTAEDNVVGYIGDDDTMHLLTAESIIEAGKAAGIFD